MNTVPELPPQPPDQVRGWQRLPGYYRTHSSAARWVALWNERRDGFTYQAFGATGRRDNGHKRQGIGIWRKAA